MSQSTEYYISQLLEAWQNATIGDHLKLALAAVVLGWYFSRLWSR
jgi:hypothetical protein